MKGGGEGRRVLERGKEDGEGGREREGERREGW